MTALPQSSSIPVVQEPLFHYSNRVSQQSEHQSAMLQKFHKRLATGTAESDASGRRFNAIRMQSEGTPMSGGQHPINFNNQNYVENMADQ